MQTSEFVELAYRTPAQPSISMPPTASGFSLRKQDGKEIYRWFKPVAQANGR